MAVSKRLRFEIFRRDNNTCRYCGRSAPEAVLRIDHVIPVTLGGGDEPSNLVTACEDCNSGKSSIAPDAAIVANVESDAIRWASAQKLAAERMLEEFDSRDEGAQQFEKRWHYWTTARGRRAHLSNDYAHSVDSFLSAGLPMELILDSLDKAMRKASLAPGDVFKYMCGIAWGRVRELRERTAHLVQPPAQQIERASRDPDIEFMKGWHAANEEFAEGVFDYFAPEKIDGFISRGKATAIDDGDEFDDQLPDREDSYLLRRGALQAVAELYGNYYGYDCAVRELRSVLPTDLRVLLVAQAERDFTDRDFQGSEEDKLRWLVHLVCQEIKQRGIPKGAEN